MKKLIIPCLIAAALATLSACTSVNDKTPAATTSSTTTTTPAAPASSTTTTETH